MTSNGRKSFNWIDMGLLSEIKGIKSDEKTLREFGRTIGIFFLLLAAFVWWRGKNTYPYFLALGGFFLFFGFLAPALLKPIQKVWMGIALVMGAVMTRVLLCVLFYLVVTPVALVARLSGKKFLTVADDPTGDSYWTAHDHKRESKESFESQF